MVILVKRYFPQSSCQGCRYMASFPGYLPSLGCSLGFSTAALYMSLQTLLEQSDIILAS